MCYVVIGQENQKQSHVKQLSKEKKDLDMAIKIFNMKRIDIVYLNIYHDNVI